MGMQSDGQFGAGAHFCLGWGLYMAEAKSLLAIYARHHTLSLVGCPHPCEPDPRPLDGKSASNPS